MEPALKINEFVPERRSSHFEFSTFKVKSLPSISITFSSRDMSQAGSACQRCLTLRRVPDDIFPGCNESLVSPRRQKSPGTRGARLMQGCSAYAGV
ncbi:Hypothetical protein NTJ_07616 [Nesidiocoris tenuis]|uniref:Uncharacterized protein n=1 Tax=Nesidiocoris tenuis TaxID=355587 RepID=A0ABN7ARG6_9HEMI|nr:Hypothetical protein NTJ_07616 [Nesidiocoris tenuis]